MTEVEAAPDSPRAAVAEFLKLCKAGDFAGAAHYLTLPEGQEALGPTRAQQLKAVLDRHLVLDLEKVSPLPEGRLDDGLPAYLEEVGAIPMGRSLTGPVRLVRRSGSPRPWTFSKPTVVAIDGWYDALPDRWIRGVLPPSLMRPGPLGLLAWQWLAFPVLLLVGWALGRLVGGGLRRLLDRLLLKTETEWDNRLLERMSRPMNAALTLVAIWALLPWLGLDAPAAAGVVRFLKAAGILIFYWALWNAVDLAGTFGLTSGWAQANQSSRSLVAIGARFGKVIVAILGILTALGELGYPVGSLLAGLGIGGLAVALAAQKTLEHLFGSVAIGVDKPFQVGDFVKIGDVVGTVEAVGLRSTRIRTRDRTLVTIPNGKLADMQIESLTARDRWRFATTVSLVYGSTASQIRGVVQALEGVLRAQPKVWPDIVVVKVKDLSPNAIDIEVTAWFVAEEMEFLAIRQEVLIQFLEVIERAGTQMAHPTRTVHLVGTVPTTPEGSR